MGATPTIAHRAVMVEEVCALLRHDRPARYVDCTLGGGGHTRALLQNSPAPILVISLDRDPACIAAAQQWGAAWGTRFQAIHSDFRHLTTVLAELSQPLVDSILFDLGVSSYQLDTATRGFSFRLDGPLDMRMDPTQTYTAEDFVNQASAEQLQQALYALGEARWARRITRAIVAERQRTRITRTRHLAELVAQSIPRAAWPTHIHPATRVFQALRMTVNDELAALTTALPQAVAALRAGGRLGVIAFHSGEDQVVKTFMRQAARGCGCPPHFPQCICGQQPQLRLLTRKPRTPGPDELQENPRSRSARFRVAEKLGSEE
ncbi:MAG: 16S rRNA (cytosine(1402)-N(4))-methyltransferase RsmH [Candidatus Tectomicrobia bacterium]|uniref:Ribosomal RNA small subunit methyltransferase H n=1 Tax=Tectimicrobiota bacterium TaxID=2528274 RepID=A0A937VW77_UNCTE|nr:16S rRNA (cytosine(1402)-N(4))-methyltransferase RsmH [Candidatus Tectomicrobia bacterium]